MTTDVPLLVRPFENLVGTDVATLPTHALSDYFGALGVALRFADGAPAPNDLSDHPDEVADFCRAQAPQPPGTLPWPGVIVIAQMSVDGPRTNGILLDLDRRGVCAVFTKSRAFRDGDADERFEIYAHEIGHMLNLTHADASDRFPTAMSQWGARSGVRDRGAVWRDAITNGSAIQRVRLPAFFGDGSRRPLGLPMSSTCCRWLDGTGASELVPWGGPFRDDSQGGPDDAARGLVQCTLLVRTKLGSVAQPVDIQVQIGAVVGRDAVEVPGLLDLRSGLIELHITSPRGKKRVYRPRSRSCGSTRRRLEYGKTIRRNYALLGDEHGLLFPVAGTYRLEAVLPTLGSRSGQVPFEVRPAIGPFARRAFGQFLARDLPVGDQTGWRALSEALATPAVSPATKAFLRSVAAARGREAFAPLEDLRRDAAPRVLERDALLRVVRLRRSLPVASTELRRAIEDAEDVLRQSDDENPSIEYLEYLKEQR